MMIDGRSVVAGRERGGKPISMILHGPLLAAVSGFSFFGLRFVFYYFGAFPLLLSWRSYPDFMTTAR